LIAAFVVAAATEGVRAENAMATDEKQERLALVSRTKELLLGSACDEASL